VYANKFQLLGRDIGQFLRGSEIEDVTTDSYKMVNTCFRIRNQHCCRKYTMTNRKGQKRNNDPENIIQNTEDWVT
jgi:hypothetical protein